METCRMASAEDLARYDAWVRSHPEGSLWQSLEWKKYQETLRRETKIYALMEGDQILASALVIIDRTLFGLSTWDIPRGPLWDLGLRTEDLGQFLETIVMDAKNHRCFSLYLSPSTSSPSPKFPARSRPIRPTAGRAEQRSGGQVPSPSPRLEQPSATRIIDLTRSEEDILRQMKPKGRYNISVAEKNGVRVQESDDIDAFYTLLKETRRRDKFTIHPRYHYEAFLKELPGSFLFLAASPPNPLSHATPLTSGEGAHLFHETGTEAETMPPPLRGGNVAGSERGVRGGEAKPIAALLGVIWGLRGYYYYGASDYAQRGLMAPYALQWAAMRRCNVQGCTTYDLLGIAPPDTPPDHPWQGVSTFKEKFGGSAVTYPPEQQIILRPLAHRLLQLKRKLLG